MRFIFRYQLVFGIYRKHGSNDIFFEVIVTLHALYGSVNGLLENIEHTLYQARTVACCHIKQVYLW